MARSGCQLLPTVAECDGDGMKNDHLIGLLIYAVLVGGGMYLYGKTRRSLRGYGDPRCR